MTSKKIVLVATACDATNIVYHALQQEFGVDTVIIEGKESTKKFLQRRVKRLGVLTVFGQVCFQLLISKGLSFLSKKRYKDIVASHKLNPSTIPLHKIKFVSSINSQESIALLQQLNPDVVIVNGTRIIAKKVLDSVTCKFINTHAGITPMYRGVHGTYWALVNNDAANSGVTVHYVDQGIDTGNIIAQAHVAPTAQDNFSTYPTLQLATGIKLLLQAIEKHFSNSITTQSETGESNLYYHPTIWFYLYHRIFKGIK
jgi:folate-dependent phosphoribosylglycinamide formyltransferase PurN